ncbi:WXG100 family type VII secretion target [Bifidobacterium castoris]|uniref:ESAT-6-like protein n=1 Tax=Bifidobacterium castoris TaxID=2306972 RepID=A0A430F684_9BIFI|nr:WXG100 family type VII secretion target [Bifidobacterium castoris]RSX47174.1 glnD [Bifidobacterium castoris]
MVGSISVKPAQVQTLAQDIMTDSRGIDAKFEELEGQVRTLIGQWDGEAREAYYDAQRKWNARLQEMNQILAKISNATTQIAQQYVDTDNRAAGFFGN